MPVLFDNRPPRSTALEVEAIVQAQGATPATVGVVRGRVHVGLSPDDLEELASGDRETSLKISRRDLPYAISQVRPPPPHHLNPKTLLLVVHVNTHTLSVRSSFSSL